MRVFEILAIGLAVAISSGCATNHDAESGNQPTGPNMTTGLNLGDSSDSILSKYGKPLNKKGYIESDGKKMEDWYYTDAVLSFKDGSLNAFKPR